MRLALAFVLIGSAAQAERPGAFDVLAAHGCTLEPVSRAALVSAGFEAGEIEELVKQHIEDGSAKQERAYTVFAQEVCRIALPQVTSPARLSDPDIAAQISGPMDFVEETRKLNAEFGGDDSGEGCYFRDVATVFDTRAGGERGAGVVPYIGFLAAEISAGNVRFYETSPLKTPIGMRVMTGDCAQTEGAEAILENHDYFEEGFGAYVRAQGADAECDGQLSTAGMKATHLLQGADMAEVEKADPPINAWLWFEFEIIARGAGWFEGMGPTTKGTPRPPLCTYGALE